MVKVIVLAIAFTALVAFATAHSTIVTTTIEDENPRPDFQIECFHGLKRNRFVQCQKYLKQDQSPYDNSRQQEQGLEPCCQELRNVQEKCQCQAVSKVFDDAKLDREKQGGQFGAQMIQQLKQKVQNLPNKCNLQTEQCKLGTVITITEDETYDNTRSRDSHQCSEKIERQRFNQCQRYLAQQSSSPSTLLMKTDRPEQQSQQLKQCCNELQNVNHECQCEAMQEVYRKAKKHQQQQKQQQQQQHQGSEQLGAQQQQRELEQIREVVQNLRDECNLQVEHCRIPSAMF